MKSLLHILLFFLLLTQIHFPQWTNQNPVPDGNHLWSTFFVDDNTGWIVGSGGFIKKTTNAGLDWVQQNSSTTLTLKSVQFINQNTGWICGEAGLIIKTTDGGQSWFELTSGTTVDLTDLQFINQNVGYVVGFSGTIIKSTNGGMAWIAQTSGTTNNLFSVDFLDTELGYAAGKGNKFLKTTDGGLNWQVATLDLVFATTINCVEFIDANVGFVGAGDQQYNWGTISKTTDGGETWSSNLFWRPTYNEDITAHQKIDDNTMFDIRYGIHSIHFKDANSGFAGGGSSTGWNRCIYSTTNAGATWQMKYGGSEQTGLLSVFVNDNGKGWAVGYYGVIYITEDNGSSWSQILSGTISSWTGDRILSVYFVNDSTGWASGLRKGAAYYRIILKTTNGGKIWKTQSQEGYYNSATAYHELYFINEDIGWIRLLSNFIEESYITMDGGENWSPFEMPYYYVSNSQYFFINDSIGWKTTDKIYKTTDGGNSWSVKNNTICYGIFFTSTDIGWVCGDAGLIMKSTDGGENWDTQVSPTTTYLGPIRFYDNNFGVCLGQSGMLIATTNGGDTWSIKPTGVTYQLQSIQFANSPNSWIINGNLYTSDGGSNWEALSNGTHFTQKEVGWSWSGNNILKYIEEPILPTNHFTAVWSGNPYLPMNIYVTLATIDGENLEAGDEIGLFDGEICVGSIELTGPIPPGGYVQIIASTDDPTTPEIDGFIAGNNIVYKFWDSNSQSEIIRITPTYSNGNGAFISQGTAVVELHGIYTTTQHTGLISGWNILSLMTIPDEPNMLQLLDPLIAADVLIKVQDEAGNAVEQLPPPIGWINNIGDWEPTEGYYTKLKPNSAATLSVTGPLVSLPLNIPLTNGWNIMGYPVPSNQNALDVLQPLISSNQLIKVQDQAGNAVEQLPPPIGWINNIGDFQAGEGYYIKVNTNTALTLNQPTLKRGNKDNWWLESNKPLNITTVHFTPVWGGNGYLNMNIYVTGVDLIGGGGLSAGDEIAVFDGEYCVGAVLITEPIPPGGFVQILAATDDPLTPERDGFLSGNSIIYKFWLSATSEEIDEYTANYESGFSGIFQSQGTTVVSFTNVLPVELVSFRAEVNESKVQLNWQTATEVNNYGFEVERKINNEEWMKLGFVEGHGNSNSPKAYLFTDNRPVGGSKFQYRLKQIDTDGKFEYSNEIEVEIVPTVFAIYQNYPNPFNPTTIIRYQLPKESKVVIKIYDILGAEVITLLNAKKDPGVYEVELNAQNLSSGTYIYRIVAGSFIETKKMVLLR